MEPMVLYFDCRLKYLRKYLNHHLDVMSEISSVKGVKRMDAPTKGSKTLGLKWLIAFAVPIALCFIPMSSDVTPEIRRFLVVTVWAILMFMFELLDTAIVSLAMIFGYILFQVVPIETALSAWMNTTVWMAIASFIIVNVVQKTKLLERLAYSLVIMTGGSYMGILFGIAIMSIVFCLLVPSTVTSMIVMAIAYGLCRALKLEVGKASAGIMLTSIICFVEATNFLYVPQCIGLSASVVGVSVDYLDHWCYLQFLYDAACLNDHSWRAVWNDCSQPWHLGLPGSLSAELCWQQFVVPLRKYFVPDLLHFRYGQDERLYQNWCY